MLLTNVQTLFDFASFPICNFFLVQDQTQDPTLQFAAVSPLSAPMYDGFSSLFMALALLKDIDQLFHAMPFYFGLSSVSP